MGKPTESRTETLATQGIGVVELGDVEEYGCLVESKSVMEMCQEDLMVSFRKGGAGR